MRVLMKNIVFLLKGVQEKMTDKAYDDMKNENGRNDKGSLNYDITKHEDMDVEVDVLNTMQHSRTTKIPSHRVESDFLRIMDSDDVSKEEMEEYSSTSHGGTLWNNKIFPDLYFISKCFNSLF